MTGIASHRRPFKKRLGQLNDGGLQDIEETKSAQVATTNESLERNELGVAEDSSFSTPPTLIRQFASVFLTTETHRLRFDKQTSLKCVPLICPLDGPKMLFGKAGGKEREEPSCYTGHTFSDSLVDVTYLFSRENSTSSLHPGIEPAPSPVDNGPSTTNQRFIQATGRGEGMRCTSPPKNRPGEHFSRAQPGKRTSSSALQPRLSIVHDTARKSRSSYERVLIEQDFCRRLEDTTETPRVASANPRPRKGLRKSSSRTQSNIQSNIQSKTTPNAPEIELDNAFELPVFLRTEEGRKSATIQDVLDILVIPPRSDGESLQSHSDGTEFATETSTNHRLKPIEIASATSSNASSMQRPVVQVPRDTRTIPTSEEASLGHHAASDSLADPLLAATCSRSGFSAKKMAISPASPDSECHGSLIRSQQHSLDESNFHSLPDSVSANSHLPRLPSPSRDGGSRRSLLGKLSPECTSEYFGTMQIRDSDRESILTRQPCQSKEGCSDEDSVNSKRFDFLNLPDTETFQSGRTNKAKGMSDICFSPISFGPYRPSK